MNCIQSKFCPKYQKDVSIFMLIYEGQKYPLELKIRYREKYVEKGIKQTACDVNVLGCNERWFAVFDRRSTVK